MNEDLHSEDERFRKAYERTEDDPSPEVWEKINARLDSQDAVYYRNRFITWKRIACLLLLLLGTTVLYQMLSSKEETGTLVSKQLKTGSGNQKNDSATKQLTADDAMHQDAGKFTDTAYALHNDRSNWMATGKVHRSYYHKQSLPAKTNAEHTNSLPVDRETVPAELSLTAQLTDSSGNRLSLQNRSDSNVSDLALNFKRQTINPSANNTERQKEDQIITSRKDQSPSGKDSAYSSAFAVDSTNSRLTALSDAHKTTIKLHKPTAGSWTITPFISADVTGYELDDDDNERGNGSQPEHHRQEIEERETHQFSFSAGAFAKWQFTPRLSLRTGLIYSNIAIGIQPQTLYASKDDNQTVSYKFITSSGYAYVKPVFNASPGTGDSINAEISHHHLQFLSVPFSIGYKFNANKRLSITPGVGVSANILLSTRIKTEVNEDTDKEMIVINKLQGLRKTYFSFMADAEINYFLNKRFSVSLLPIFKYAINPITKDNVVRTFPYSAGIGAGMTYSF